MKRYYLRLRALSPLSITSHQNVTGQVNPTLSYIPGPTLRGAIAWRWLRENPAAAQTPGFQRLFDREELRCGPLYPLAAPAREAGIGYRADLSLPLPFTARTCKLEPGFRRAALRNERGHGVVDTLVDALEEVATRRLRLAKETPPDEWRGLARHERCGQAGCKAAMDRFSGYYVFGEARGQPWFRQVRPALRLISRTAILDELESAQPAALFSRQAVEAGQEFAGFLDVTSEAEADLQQLLSSSTDLYIGAGRTAGLGQMEVIEIDSDWGVLTKLLGPVIDRQQAFEAQLSASLRQRWTLVPLTLLSDTILLDSRLRHVSAPEPDVLRHYAALEGQIQAGLQGVETGDNEGNGAATPVNQPLPTWPPGTELFLTIAKTKRISGWNTAPDSDRPRSDDWAVAAGSVFVLAAPANQASSLLQACAWLEENGLGERRAEGFGQVIVAHPFHTEVAPS